jgi:hypothetical protein
MTRYFYRDSLAAAWMAKHFGMRLRPDCYEERALPVGEDVTRFTHHAFRGRYYTHVDSIHLLDPQDGDAVEFDRWHWERQRHDDLKDASPQPHFALVKIDGDWKHIFSAGIGWDRVRVGERFSLPFKIIQRRGIAFHWPESDTA